MESSSIEKKKHKPTLGKQCAAWGCDNKGLIELEDGSRFFSGLSFFTFPKDQATKNVWCNRIKRVDGKDNFNVNSSTVLCEQHFAPSDIKKPFGGTKKSLRKGAKPLLFHDQVVEQEGRKRKPPTHRASPKKKAPKIIAGEDDDQEELNQEIVEKIEDENVNFSVEQNENIELASKNVPDVSVQEYDQMKTEIANLKAEIAHMKSMKFVKCKFIEHVISSTPDICNHYTGLPSMDILKAVYDFLDPGVIGENVILYNNQQLKGLSSAGRPRHLSPLESFVLTLVRIRRNFDITHMSYLFQVSESTVSNTFLTWINFLYVKLGSLCIWPTREQVIDSMPESMKEKFPNVRCIIDCVEFKIAVPSSLIVHKLMYSDYKSHTTVKVLVGIAPGGGFTFISSAFPGSISDKNIVVKSGLLYPQLWESGDAIMADRGFLIADYVQPLGVSLIIPSFLKGRNQLDESEVVVSQQIAAERIHVERMIQRIKCFHIFDRVIPVNMLGSLNQIISVCAILCNFQEPIIK